MMLSQCKECKSNSDRTFLLQNRTQWSKPWHFHNRLCITVIQIHQRSGSSFFILIRRHDRKMTSPMRLFHSDVLKHCFM